MTTPPEEIAGRRDSRVDRRLIRLGRQSAGRRLIGAPGLVRRAGRDLVVAIAATGAAFTLLELVLPSGTSSATYATASAAIAIAALSSGLAAGILALGLAAAAALYLHLPPVGAFAASGLGDLLGLALFGLNGLTVAMLGAWLRSRRAQRGCGRVSPAVPATSGAVRTAGTPADVPGAFRTVAIVTTMEVLVEPLTDREFEVLGLLASGFSNEEIAAALFVSLNTVKTHLKNIFGKLGVTSRLQATVRAGRLGLLDPGVRPIARSVA